jgi:uncharacterized protein (DUF1330 family)
MESVSMAAYLLASYDVTDPDGYQNYVEGVVPLLARHGAEVLVVDHEADKLEGDTRGTYIVLKFDSETAAMAWYNDPDYAPVKKLRLNASTNGSMVMASQFVMPEG